MLTRLTLVAIGLVTVLPVSKSASEDTTFSKTDKSTCTGSIFVRTPEVLSPLAIAELRRLQPDVELGTYDPHEISAGPCDVVAGFRLDHAEGGVLAQAVPSARRIYVFTRDVERAIRKDAAHPIYQIALGRLLAHELEHVRRGAGSPHDTKGFFAACLTPRTMVELGWGR